MPYIPEKHKKYNLLPYCREHSGEVFEYPDSLDEVDEILRLSGGSLMPYGYNSYEEYYRDVDRWIEKFKSDDDKRELLEQFKREMIQMNQKEQWSVLKYIGESTGSCFGLTNGNYYYWPTRIENPGYNGVIDDEEFTSYLHPTEPQLWEIAEDPTGMAYRTIYKKENYHSSEDVNFVLDQVKASMEKDEYIYLSVEFCPNAEKTYYYTTDDSSIERGDYVIVPAGINNEETMVNVVRKDCIFSDTIPSGYENIKRVIRKVNSIWDCDEIVRNAFMHEMVSAAMADGKVYCKLFQKKIDEGLCWDISNVGNDSLMLSHEDMPPCGWDAAYEVCKKCPVYITLG